MTLGKVNVSVADGTFDPVRDEVRLKDGRVLQHYYRDTLKIKYFQPIDKTRFQLPPAGWCSWYFYYQEINQEEASTRSRIVNPGGNQSGRSEAQCGVDCREPERLWSGLRSD